MSNKMFDLCIIIGLMEELEKVVSLFMCLFFFSYTNKTFLVDQADLCIFMKLIGKSGER
jgi:hypothetical protein